MLAIENNQLKVEINEIGAQLTHVVDKTTNADYIWNGSEWERHAPILFPAIGKSNDNKYILNGKIYEMKQHGFARDYPWTVVDKGDDRVSLTLTENEETLAVYPFHFSLMVTYTLEANQLKIEFLVKNNSEETMPFGLGFHPGFNVPIAGAELEFSDYELTLSPEVTELTQFQIDPIPFRNGKIIPVPNAQKGTLPLSYAEFDNGLIIINNPGLTGVELSSAKSEHKISLTLEDFPYIALWTMTDPEAKFLCMGPFAGLPDIKSDELTDWMKKEGNNLLAPNESSHFSTTITLE